MRNEGEYYRTISDMFWIFEGRMEVKVSGLFFLYFLAHLNTVISRLQSD